jgi:NADP-dependent 3-hydroxy acid dehydrogenase YdfG
MQNIRGKMVILTGSSSGIGEATAKLFAENGAKVVLAARREKRLQVIKEQIEVHGGTAEYHVTDVTLYEDMEKLAQFTLDQSGQIDVLVKNAGTMPLSYLHEKKVTEWDHMIDVNIRGVLYGIGAVLPHMRERRQGHIIDVSSVTGTL